MQPKRARVALVALVVAACGGGGGGSEGPSSAVGTAITSGAGPTQVALGSAAGLSFSDFGYWNTPTGPANFYASGILTPAAQLPPTGADITAAYNGTYAETHTAYNSFGTMEPAGSDTGGIQINADFGARTFAVTFTSGFVYRMLGVNESLGANGRGSINSNGSYSVTASNLSNAFPASVTVNGAFYGPSNPSQAPLETAGTFSGRIGTRPDGTVTGFLTGSFGAHR
jgi:hypothetical protein